MADRAEATESALELVPVPAIQKRILVVRERQVMLDEDLAELYGVETRSLVQQVTRNRERFPSDFMFRLAKDEAAALRSQSVRSNTGRGGRRYAPYVFTEQGVAMLSSVLRSKRAVAVNIAIMRAFVELRRVAASDAAIARAPEDRDAAECGSWELTARNSLRRPLPPRVLEREPEPAAVGPIERLIRLIAA